MRRVLGMVLAAVLATGAARAQTPPAANTLVKATAAPVQVTAGSAATVRVHLAIAPGWHIYSNPPTLEYNIPTRVTLTGGAGLTPGKPVYPAGRKVKLASDEQVMSVYDGELDVTLPLAAAASAVNGDHTLRGSVDYQSCNDQMCLPPVAVPFTVAVSVANGAPAAVAAPSTAAAPESAAVAADTAAVPGEGFMTAPPAGGAAPETADERKAREALAKGWAWWLLLLFGSGLALNLTPCVFPMLGITVSIFGARKAETTPRAVLNAVVYVLGIATMYTVLGVIAGLTGGFFGGALQNPIVLVVLGLVLLVLSLSMFGVYEMQAPTWLLDRAGGANTSSLAGLYVSGLVVGVVAAPCIGPFVLSVLGVIAQRASVSFGVQTMLAMSLGLGAPYLVLATFSNLLGRLPRAGEWMEWVKKLFGMLLAAIGLSYVLLGLAPRVAPWVTPAALLLGGLYLGFMEKSGNAAKRFRTFKNVLGLVAVAAGVWLVLQMTAAQSRGIAFRPYDETAVQASIAAGRGVLIDVSADWCVPCHEMELQIFPDPAVREAVKPFDAYRIDITKGSPPAATRWGVRGAPTVIFIGAGGAEVRALRLAGAKITAAEFAQRLRTAAAGLKGH